MKFQLSFDGWMFLQLFVLPVLLPMVVGLVTTRVTSSAIKAVLLVALSVITSLITELLNAYNNGLEVFNLGEALMTAMITFVFGVGVHFGLLKPTGTSEVLADSGRTADGYGEIN